MLTYLSKELQKIDQKRTSSLVVFLLILVFAPIVFSNMKFPEVTHQSQPLAVLAMQDSAVLASASAVASASATPGTKSQAQANASGEKDYYPQTNLLIFIIPLGILFLTIFFA